GLIAEMRAHATYKDRVISSDGSVAVRIKNRMQNVDKVAQSGTIWSVPNSTVGQLESTTLGSYGLGLNYSGVWHAGPWEIPWHSLITRSCRRKIEMKVTVHYTLRDLWDFKSNPQYSRWKN